MSTRILRKLILLNVLFLAACNGLTPALVPVEGYASSNIQMIDPLQTAAASAAPSLTPSLTWTPLPAFTNTPTRAYSTRTPSSTPVPLVMFTSANLIPQAAPTSYLDPCEYLRNRWDDTKSAPGTVVVAVMYHQVVANAGAMTSPNQVTAAVFRAGLNYARRLGFKSITARQMADFLETNAAIPPRSILLLIDDLETPAIRDQYEKALAEFGFNATLAYIGGQRDANEWEQVEALLASGRFELQAHGFLHNDLTYIFPTTPEETLVQEIFKPVDVIEEHSGQKPVAFIWPGGDYTSHAVDLAAKAGYRLGFTVRNRGPVLYNWIPQGTDEQGTEHPLLLLPRAWSRDVLTSLDRAVSISAEAQVFADVQREKEINWYTQYCKHPTG